MEPFLQEWDAIKQDDSGNIGDLLKNMDKLEASMDAFIERLDAFNEKFE